jgi:tRNA-specific 2-thiouridylase
MNIEINKIIKDVIEHIEESTKDLNKKNSEIKIMVAMSGGVDSSVCPIFFKEAGFNVKGMTLKLYENKFEKEGACCSFRDIFDAKRVCQQLSIEHYVINYEKQFKKEVIDKFVSEYTLGRTPIPCIQCNQVIKFDYMFELIKDLEFDFLVTGHYILRKKNNKGELNLYIPEDKSKDQSYFLYNITSNRLNNLLFPLGILTKNKIRLIAEYFSIQTSKKPESQDICFVEGKSYRDFLKDFSSSNKISFDNLVGNFILNSTGEIISKHDGIQNYTIGQRKGLKISHSKPLYVIKIDEKTKDVFVGEKHELMKKNFFFQETSWVYKDNIIDYIKKNGYFECNVRLRSMHKNIQAKISIEDTNPEIFNVELNFPQYLICPGQACVVYDIENEVLLGGGTII